MPIQDRSETVTVRCFSLHITVSKNCHSERSRTLSEVEGDGEERNLLFSSATHSPAPTPFSSSFNSGTNRSTMTTTRHTLALLLFVAIVAPLGTYAQSASADKPFVVEYYYKTKWGHADEFLKLFKKNHYPLLKKAVEIGRMSKVWMDQPRYHTTEDGRWDFRVTIVFKNATVANQDFDETQIKKDLFPDQETYAREEQRRFEILDAHWDLPVKTMDLEGK